ncbi:hypothetical protein ACFSKU_01595 [Pontibacter silvestris]|uniref:Uncharacterized protein n=1 Tax=Pontibacter silvestris TaxID=2305183 RepID=A0ABW4WUM5_9BACT|nr:hypothetical protein [Pontibacter silvestris]MCC9136302.1 hypothetical protein [Pontibacter silvestris]
MKILFLFMVMLVLPAMSEAGSDTSQYKIAELRGLYLKATQDEEAGKEFHKFMDKYNGNHPVILAYKAASEASMAKYVWNPYSKLKHLKTSASIFEKAVKLDKDEPEIRFLRFTVEHYVPRYLKLSEHLNEDKKIIINSLKNYPASGLSPGLAKIMRDIMLSEDLTSEDEKKILRNVRI